MIKVLRTHQEKARRLGQEVHSGAFTKKVVCAYVTPGGGKTLMASLFAHEALKRECSRVLFLCPRDALRTQNRDGFHVPALGLHGGLVAGFVSSKSLFRADRAGCVATYQDVLANPARWLKFVEDEDTLVILDEAHHLPAGPVASLENEEEAGWTQVVRPIVESAKRVLMMTGSKRRSGGEPIAFIVYGENREPIFDVEYTRRDALEEHAVLKVSAQLCDGEARYWHSLTGEHCHRLSQVGSEEESRARRALLDSDDYRTSMVRLALDDLGKYRSTRNPRARAIVICNTQAHARAVFDSIREDGSYRPVLAISTEPNAAARIARFRDRGEGEVLVTVGMAYEGLDVPDCTHMICLSNNRARSWLEQALSRVTRLDRGCSLPWEEQTAYIYVPNDPSMVQFLSEWIEEQPGAYGDPPVPRDGGVGEVEARRRGVLVSKAGELDGIKYADTYGVFAPIDQRRIFATKLKFPFLAACAAKELLDIGRQCWPDDADVPGSEAAAE